jgi:plastocyanin domain-containing protein
MLKSHSIWSLLLSLGLLLGINQITTADNLPSQPAAQIRFQKIPQPWPLKVGVTLGGVALIGLELWWFLASKTKA